MVLLILEFMFGVVVYNVMNLNVIRVVILGCVFGRMRRRRRFIDLLKYVNLL